jgi:DNA-binding NarL/FixJ family response regulator
MLKVLIADDHPLFRQALQLAVGDVAPDDHETFEASTMDDVLRAADATPDLDLLLLDLTMPGMDGLSGLIELRRRHPHLPVVIVSATEDAKVIRETLSCGAMGYIPKSLDRDGISSALRQVLEGDIWVPQTVQLEDEPGGPSVSERMASLTPQQLKVLRLMVSGKPNKIIAYELDIAETTVKAHITVILRKLAVHSRTQAVLASRDFFAPAA